MVEVVVVLEGAMMVEVVEDSKKMKLDKILFITLILIFLSIASVSATRYVDYDLRKGRISGNGVFSSTTIPINDVNVIGFVCSDSNCGSVQGTLWSGQVLNSGDDQIQLTYPTILQSFSGYGVYYYKEGYIIWEGDPNWWGISFSDPQGPFNVYLSKKEDCLSPVSILSLNPANPEIGDSVTITSQVDASIIHAGPLDYVPPQLLDDYYSVWTRVNLDIYRDGILIHNDSTDILMPFGSSQNIPFTWSGPTLNGNYTINVTTDVIDSKCSSALNDSDIEIFNFEELLCGNGIIDEGEQCEIDNDCGPTLCGVDECVGDDWYDYADVSNDCLGDCACEDNQCELPEISYNDERCTECQDDSDCDYLDNDYCSGDLIKHDEGVCVDFVCGVNTTTTLDCDNGLYCDGDESCLNANCVAGTPPVINDGVGCTDDYCDEVNDVVVNSVNDSNCDNGLYCDGVETCDAELDCQIGTNVDCSYLDDQCNTGECSELLDQCTVSPEIFSTPCEADSDICTIDHCNGQGSCVFLEDNPDCFECTDDSDCDNGLYCDGDEACIDNECVSGTAPVCDDGLFCDGVEVCDEETDSCEDGLSIDCTGNDLQIINRCDNNPDNNPFTWDFFFGFTSTCDEDADTCTTGVLDIDHACAVSACGAECEIDDDCADTECDYLDGCVGEDYYDYDDVANDCLGDCACEDNSCGTVGIYVNDSRCMPECLYDSDCDDGVYCNGGEICIDNECESGIVVDCSGNDLQIINTCDNNPDNNPFTWDYADSFTSTCDEDADSCTTGSQDITHVCDIICGSEPECEGIEAGTGNCTIQCQYKPPYFCERDGEYGLDFGEGHEFVCNENNTYYQCNENGSAYVHVNECSYYCSADLACEGVAPGNSLNACNIYGETYLEDYCDGNCRLKDDNCESDLMGCTSDPECDELIPGTGICSNQCLTSECQDDSDCDDGVYCNGQESCVGTECIDGTSIDCSGFDLLGISACDNNPDNNPFTWDFFFGFTSTCDEDLNICTTGIIELEHTCDINICGAECEIDEDCSDTECDYLDGCVGEDYYDYDDVANDCLGDCICSNNACDEVIISENDERCGCDPGDFERISYSTRDTGDVLYINDYDEFTSENVDFFHGYIHQRDGNFFGYGSMHARGTATDGTKIQLNVKFDVTELIEFTCDYVTWRNYARGTYWIYGEGTREVEYDYMDITYHLDTGLIEAVGVGDDVDFEFRDMIDRRFG